MSVRQEALLRHGLVPECATALGIADYVAASLCGVVSTGPTAAASWGLYNLSKGVWHRDTVRAFGVPASILPELRRSGRPLGGLDEALRERLGLPSGAAVCAPVGDNQASVLGTGGGSAGNDGREHRYGRSGLPRTLRDRCSRRDRGSTHALRRLRACRRIAVGGLFLRLPRTHVGRCGTRAHGRRGAVGIGLREDERVVRIRIGERARSG